MAWANRREFDAILASPQTVHVSHPLVSMRRAGRGFAPLWQYFRGLDVFDLKAAAVMRWIQRTLHLPAQPTGFHLITREVIAALPELGQIDTGMLYVFLQHTSASLTINENADPDVPADLETAFSAIAPEDFPYRHTAEGPDDMPAHVKASLLGCSLTIPVGKGQLCLGTWQGIYLCEHRRQGGRRKIVLTLWGESQ